jgi:DNA-binding NarL/FixJ family response regulator
MHSKHQSACDTSLFLVEDSAPIRERLVALLSPVASVVGFADNASDAISDILKLRPGAVLLDLNLASGSGIDVLRALGKRAPDIDVFVLTNFASPQYRRLCLGLGARGFFDKSTEFEKVRDAIAARNPQFVQ